MLEEKLLTSLKAKMHMEHQLHWLIKVKIHIKLCLEAYLPSYQGQYSYISCMDSSKWWLNGLILSHVCYSQLMWSKIPQTSIWTKTALNSLWNLISRTIKIKICGGISVLSLVKKYLFGMAKTYKYLMAMRKEFFVVMTASAFLQMKLISSD